MEKPIFPELHLFPRLEAVGRFISRLVRFLPENAPEYMSEHYLAEQAEWQPELPFEGFED